MLTWLDGPRRLGCAYHKKAGIRLGAVTGQVDVFVMPKIARVRPIAVTLNVRTLRSGSKTLRGSVATIDDAIGLRTRLTPKLIALGVPEGRAVDIVGDTIGLIQQDAHVITAALSDAPMKPKGKRA
jgi:hypothetical protein